MAPINRRVTLIVQGPKGDPGPPGSSGSAGPPGPTGPEAPLDSNLVMIAEADNGPILSVIREVPVTDTELAAAIEDGLAANRRGSGIVDGAVGTIQLDMSEADTWLVSSTAGNYTLDPINHRTNSIDTLYVTVYTTTTGHALTFGRKHRSVGLKASETAWTAGQKRTFRFTHIPNVDEWIAEELSAQFGVAAGSPFGVELDSAHGLKPSTDPVIIEAPFTPAVYRFDSGNYSSGGVATSPSTTVGLGAASANNLVHLAVVDAAGNAYSSEIDRVRWYWEPTSTNFSTWTLPTLPAIGDNGFSHLNTLAPWMYTFDTRYVPTGDGELLADGDYDLYAQIRFKNTFVASVKVDLTINNGQAVQPAPGAPTSFVATPVTNGFNLAWVAPVTGETGGATPSTGTDPTTWAQAWQSTTVPIPQATVSGDTVLLFVQASNTGASAPTITVPSGWTQVGTLQGSTTPVTRWQAVYRLTATGATADPTVSVVSANIFGYAIVVKNANATTPLDVAVVEGSKSTPAGATTATNNAIVIQGVVINQNNDLSLGTANSFLLEAGGAAFSATRGSSVGYTGSGVGCASRVVATAGAVTAPVWAQTGATAGTYMAWHTIVLRPAATGGTTTAVGYETRVNTGAWNNVGNVLTSSVTGLLSSTSYTLSVRAYDNIGQRGAVATDTKSTPGGGGPTVNYGKTLAGWSVNSGSTGQNWSSFRTRITSGGVYLPLVVQRDNMSQTIVPGASPWTTSINNCLSRYNGVKSGGGFLGTDPGPRLNVTHKLSFTGTNAKPPNNHVTSLLDLAVTARGDRNGKMREGAQAIKNSTAGGHDWVLQTVICPSHEANGEWYANYFNVNQPALVGVTALTQASEAEWTKLVADALKHAGATGDRGRVWALAWDQMFNTYTGVDPRFWFSLNLASASANPNPEAAGNATWNFDAIERIEGKFHSIDIDVYCRGNGRPTYNGSGNELDPANWTFTQLDNCFTDAITVANTYGVPFGGGEIGAQYNLPGYSNTGMSSDAQSAVWFRRVFDWFNARPTHLQNLWLVIPTDGVYGAKPTGTTYLPDPNRQPKTWAVFQEYFPA